jgi:dTDP-4-dehydrorhamnose 3,5-epimerase
MGSEKIDFKKGLIEGAVLTPLKKYIDERGWLVETFREDETEPVFHPVMGYTSETLPGVVRGPHEHVEQSDLFVFIGPGNFKIWLWDNRETASTYLNKMVFFAGEDSPLRLLVPPGVVHAYKNVSSGNAIVHNFPNQLFMGKNKKSPIDEIRHEADPNSAFRAD